MVLIIFLVLIPLISGDSRFNTNLIIDESNPRVNDFSKNDYTPILKEEKQNLGNITINNIDLSELEMGFYYYNTSYPEIWEDVASGALNITRFNITFIETMEPAIMENLNEEIEDKAPITVKINESLFVEYSDTSLGYLIYIPYLFPCHWQQIFIDNGTEIIQLIDETDYNIDKENFLVFNYKNYFQESSNSNFTLYLIWEYELDVNFWRLTQESDLIIEEKTQNITIDFNYHFILTCLKFNQTPLNDRIYADNIYIDLKVNLPDKNLLNDHVLKLRGQDVNINDHLNADKSIEVLLSDEFSGDQSIFSLDFTSDFSFEFINPVEETWSIDRLLEKRNIRERIFFPSIIDGPNHIYLEDISIYEPTIYFDQMIEAYSLFEREVTFTELNTTLTGKKGLQVNMPYIIAGETCPFMLKYVANQRLRIAVTDVIKMPLVGASIEIYYFGQKYGTYISEDRIQPIAPGKTNENGEIILKEVPHGNYTIRVYYRGQFLRESTVNTFKDINYIYTNYPHFPFWLMIFGIINGAILLIGLIYYKHYKKTR